MTAGVADMVVAVAMEGEVKVVDTEEVVEVAVTAITEATAVVAASEVALEAEVAVMEAAEMGAAAIMAVDKEETMAATMEVTMEAGKAEVKDGIRQLQVSSCC